LIIFQIGSCFVWANLTYDPSIYAFCITGIIDVSHHAWLVFWDGGGLTNFSPGLALYCDSSWDYRHEPLCLL
jgi:hypothetical protein